MTTQEIRAAILSAEQSIVDEFRKYGDRAEVRSIDLSIGNRTVCDIPKALLLEMLTQRAALGEPLLHYSTTAVSNCEDGGCLDMVVDPSTGRIAVYCNECGEEIGSGALNERAWPISDETRRWLGGDQ